MQKNRKDQNEHVHYDLDQYEHVHFDLDPNVHVHFDLLFRPFTFFVSMECTVHIIKIL